MIHFLKKIYEGKIDDSAHSQFVRFSKGEFYNRSVIKVRKGDKIKVNSTFELSTEFVKFIASLANKMHCTGTIFARERLQLPNEEQSKGLFSYEVDQDFDSSEIAKMSEKAYAMLLDCEGEGFSLKTKKKLPKPNPKGAEGKVNDKFCVMELDGKYWGKVKEEFLFDLPEGKKYELNHAYLIKEIIIPSVEKDPEQMRLKAKRKGIIKRKVVVDGKETVKEKEFIA